ncbi:hypothetical protein HYO65_gp063 [Tenacibaculum phage PTm1]|uniref:Uncharacterized protein n=2 Tax=Shirahamavirus PTm1 TaxID=2846435 RepID=A0A5S9HX64_9CAUD|nr:hypothetical protein HYO65_gp063 [Tenacibaculum phage PTm1]BBI90455.1 hypothetical protein [Tenacibaculum phage PTm1]BBI90763.1 hypothetical protein [Tenacibaculum phage PTm5]
MMENNTPHAPARIFNSTYISKETRERYEKLSKYRNEFNEQNPIKYELGYDLNLVTMKTPERGGFSGNSIPYELDLSARINGIPLNLEVSRVCADVIIHHLED